MTDPDLRKVAKDIAVQRSLMDDILADLVRAKTPDRRADLRDAYQAAAKVLDDLLSGETRRYVQVQGLIPGTDAIRFFSLLTAKVQEQVMAWADAGRVQDPNGLLMAIQDAIRMAARTQPKVQAVLSEQAG